MKITDKNVKKWLKAISCEELEEMLETYPEDEIDGRSEIELFTDELSYAISCYEESGHCWNEDLEQSRELLRETKNGKVIPLDPRTLRPKYGYKPNDIDAAKRTVNEYRRMKYRYKKLREAGYYGQWAD